jgi:hypothetical protein
MILLRFTTVFNVGTWPTVVNRRQSQPPQLFVALEMWPLAQRFVALEMWPVRDWPNDLWLWKCGPCATGPTMLVVWANNSWFCRFAFGFSCSKYSAYLVISFL